METTHAPVGTHHLQILELRQLLNQRIIGQTDLVNKLLITMLCDGHLLVEGAPGLAKTTAIKELASAVQASFHRIQFTPDLLPADLTGTEVFHPKDATFAFQSGPIFHHLLLADEINRAPAKVQSALLEAMAERQVTVGRKTYALPKLFMVMATQNPIEQEGTYPLPEAQLDRFLMYLKVDYPNASAERKILQLNRAMILQERDSILGAQIRLSPEAILLARKSAFSVHLSGALEEYIVQLVVASRQPTPYSKELGSWLRFGASPRATMALDRCARAHAWLDNRDYVVPEDIHAVVFDILRHRILLNFEAQADGMTTDHFISELLRYVPVP